MMCDAVSYACSHWHIGDGKSGTLTLFRKEASPICPVRICVSTELSAFLSSVCIAGVSSEGGPTLIRPHFGRLAFHLFVQLARSGEVFPCLSWFHSSAH